MARQQQAVAPRGLFFSLLLFSFFAFSRLPVALAPVPVFSNENPTVFFAGYLIGTAATLLLCARSSHSDEMRHRSALLSMLPLFVGMGLVLFFSNDQMKGVISGIGGALTGMSTGLSFALWGRYFATLSPARASSTIAVACAIAYILAAVVPQFAIGSVSVLIYGVFIIVSTASLEGAQPNAPSLQPKGASAEPNAATGTTGSLRAVIRPLSVALLGAMVYACFEGCTWGSAFLESFATPLPSKFIIDAGAVAGSLIFAVCLASPRFSRSLPPSSLLTVAAGLLICGWVVSSIAVTLLSFVGALLTGASGSLITGTLWVSLARTATCDPRQGERAVALAMALICGTMAVFMGAALLLGPTLTSIITPLATVAFLVVSSLRAGGVAQAEKDAEQGEPGEIASHLPTDQMAHRLLEYAREKELSARETEVFLLVARGHSNPYVADALVVSQNTVKTHVKRIHEKTGASSRDELIEQVAAFVDDARAT